MFFRLFASVVALLFVAAPLRAQTISVLPYQGFLMGGDGTPVTNSTTLTFRLYDTETDGRALWTETHPNVTFHEGVFSVLLGTFEPLDELPLTPPLYLSIAVGDASAGEMTPRLRLGAVPFSLRAASVSEGAAVTSLNGLTDGVTLRAEGGATLTREGNTLVLTAGSGGGAAGVQGVQSTTLDVTNPNGPTVTVDLSDASIATRHLIDGSVRTAKLADEAVTEDKLADGTVTRDKLVGGAAVTSLNGLTDDVTLQAGNNVSITTDGRVLVISASGGDATLPEPFFIDRSDNVGIGTDEPTSPLTVFGVIESIRGGFLLPDGTLLDEAGDLGGESALSEVISVDDQNQVGIGTDSPSDRLQVDADAGEDALRVRVDGTTRLRVHDNGGVSVGVNAGPPPAGLLVQGDIEYNELKTRWYSIAPWGFASHSFPGVGGAPVDIGASAVFNGRPRLRCERVDGGCENGAGLFLPHGAVITELRALVDDESPSRDLEVRLFRTSHETAAEDLMAEVASTGLPGNPAALVDTSIGNATVDNEDFAYFVEVSMDGKANLNDDSDLHLFTVRIAYTVTSPLP